MLNRNRVNKVKLLDLIEKPISGEWGGEPTEDCAIKVIRNANFLNTGKLRLDNIVSRAIPEVKMASKKLERGDVIIEKSGGSPSQPVGRVIYFDEPGTFVCSNFTSILRPKSCAYPRYLFYLLFAHHKVGTTNKFQNKTTGIINLQLARYVDTLQIPLPPLAEQRRIAAILDKADELVQNDKKALAKYDQLAQSIFLEMFGDPQQDSVFTLRALIANQAILVHKDGNFGSLYPKKSDFGDRGVPFLSAKCIDIAGNLLMDRIALLVAEKAEKLNFGWVEANDVLLSHNATVGRVLHYKGEFERALIGTSLTCFRPNSRFFCSEFLAGLFNSNWFQSQLKQNMAQATRNQVPISAQRRMKLFMPNIKDQLQYAKRIQCNQMNLNSLKASLQKSQTLFYSLLQRAFQGDL